MGGLSTGRADGIRGGVRTLMPPAPPSARALTFCDVATLYCPTGGGIRTYYQAKLAWFSTQQRHRYVLIVPGASARHTDVASGVTVVEVPGRCVNGREDSYRLFSRPAEVRRAIRAATPDVLEAGDTWWSGPLVRWSARTLHPRPLVSVILHADTHDTYVAPALDRWLPRSLASTVSALVAGGVHRAERGYDALLVSSLHAATQWRARGVAHVHHVPFGADAVFFDAGAARTTQLAEATRRVLYAGRLDDDKDVTVLLQALPALLEDANIDRVTVAGDGAHRPQVEAISHPRFRYLGYVAGRQTLARLYADHDIFVTTGTHETFGLAALEAAAAGLIVVGPDRAGTGALLSELAHPYTYVGGDPQALVHTVVAAARADRADAIRESRSLAAQYGDWHAAVGRMAGNYEGLLA